MKNSTKILFRADGNKLIGLGHVYRCLAIAEFLEEDFEIEFIAGKDCTNVKKVIPWDYDLRILLEFDSFKEEASYLAKQYERQQVLFVVDGQQFDSHYLSIFKSHGIPLVYIDDNHAISIYADLIVNHAAGFSRKDFSTGILTNVCIGPKFAIMRKPFLDSNREPNFSYDVLICFGGADPDNHTIRILKNLPKDLTVAVLVGRAFNYLEELRNEVLSMQSAFLFSGLTSQEIADLMRGSKKAIMSASNVAYEYATASSGQLYLIQTVDNQKYLYQYLISTNAARPFEGKFDPDFKPTKINDGLSPLRLLRAFLALDFEYTFEIDRKYSPFKESEINGTFYITIENRQYFLEKAKSIKNNSFYISVFKDRIEWGGCNVIINEETLIFVDAFTISDKWEYFICMLQKVSNDLMLHKKKYLEVEDHFYLVSTKEEQEKLSDISANFWSNLTGVKNH